MGLLKKELQICKKIKFMQKLMITVALLLASMVACKQSAQNAPESTNTATEKKTEVESATEKKTEAESTSPKANDQLHDISLQGSYYSPQSKEMMIIDWKGRKISKMMYASKGSRNFVEAEIVGSKGSMGTMDYEFTFKVKGKTMRAVVGASPAGIGIGVNEVGKEGESKDFGAVNDKTTTDEAKFGVVRLVREIYWENKFENEANKASLIAEDSQEGTAEGQLLMIYKTADGKEEPISAQVNPNSHELTFDSKMLGGKIRCQLDNEMWWVLRMYKGNTKIADFKQVMTSTFGN